MPENRLESGQARTAIFGAPFYSRTGRYRPALLRQLTGPGAPRDVPLERCEILIGRSIEVQVTIDSTAVSRWHAVLLRLDECYTCVDLRSSSGLYVNGEQVVSRALHDGDTLRIGDALFVYRQAQYCS